MKPGNYSGSSAILPVTTLDDTLPPSVPGGLTARFISNDRFLLEWKAATDNDLVTGYDVFIDGLFHASTVALRLAITHLESGTSYSITVIARDVAGNAYDQSEPLLVTTTGTVTAIGLFSSGESTIMVFRILLMSG